MPALLRPASPSDLPVIDAIYNHYVMHSTCTYQTVLNTLPERERWFVSHGPKHPVIVAEEGGKVIAWGSLSRLHERQAYANTVEDSIYVHHEHQRRGLGRLLLVELLRLAAEIGHHTVLGAISGDQEASIILHAKLGFVEVGRLREVGYKFDRWLDVIWMQKIL